MSPIVQVILLAILITCSSFFAFSEISIASARRARLLALSEEGDSRADRVMAMQDNPGKFFSVIQIGINMIAILGGIVGESAFTPLFSWLFRFAMPAEYASKIGFICSFLVVTFGFVIFADLLPKRISLNSPEKVSMRCVGLMSLLIKVFAPLVFILDIISDTLMRLIGLPVRRNDSITTGDILASVNAGTEAGIIAPTEQAVIENVFELENRPVTTAMTVRESVIYLSLSDTTEELHKKLAGSPHNRYPVCDETLDRVVGYVESCDILRLLLDDKPLSLAEPGLIRPVSFIPDTLSLSELLKQFQKSRTDIAVVLNEYALFVGLVTLNDVTGAVMGDLVLTPEESQIIQRDENSWLVDGATPTVDLMHALEIDELPNSSAYETTAGFMMYMLRKIPKRMDHFDWSGMRFEVIDVDDNKVDQILITKRQAAQPAAEKPAAEKPAAEKPAGS